MKAFYKPCHQIKLGCKNTINILNVKTIRTIENMKS